jgi:hypothetical protein
MKSNFTLFTILLAILSLSVFAQSEKCATMKHFAKRIANDPSALTRMEQSELTTQQWIATHPKTNSKTGLNKVKQIITIPVVVHVLYHNSIENISDAQIESQIDVLNEDFRLLNSDSLPPSHPFWFYTADTGIEFCLASSDPNGIETNGITRTYTDSTTFVGIGNEKFTSTGGKDNWNPTKYLNIWVCNLDGSDGTLGYAAFPTDLSTNPDEDGVVIRYEAFGTIGTAGISGFSGNNLGRTATHEVGHWLNLRHIWGDSFCGNDFVNDTEPAEEDNAFCPTFPHNANNSCGTGSNGEMYMNYMDYVDDDCMNMFTFGQSNRMDAALNNYRSGLLTSSGCSDPINVNEISLNNSIEIYPNPSNGNFTINVVNLKSVSIALSLYDILGSKIHEFKNITNFPFTVNLNELSSGIYYFKIDAVDKTLTKKIIISK